MNKLAETIIKAVETKKIDLDQFTTLAATIIQYRDMTDEYEDFMNMDSFDRQSIAFSIASNLTGEFASYIIEPSSIDFFMSFYAAELDEVVQTASVEIEQNTKLRDVKVHIVKALSAFANEHELNNV